MISFPDITFFLFAGALQGSKRLETPLYELFWCPTGFLSFCHTNFYFSFVAPYKLTVGKLTPQNQTTVAGPPMSG